MLLLACTPGISFTEDLGRHLLLGRLIIEKHAVPATNLLTYTFPDYPFVNHHWLSEVVFYLLHRSLGLNGLIVFKMLLMAATLAIALGTVRVRPQRTCPAGGAVAWHVELSPALLWSGLLAAILLGFRAHIRPELFSFLFVALYGWLFERIREGVRWPRWVLPLLALLWANLHIYFIIGLLMALCFAFERWQQERRPSALLREGAWLAALLLASAVNPNGLRGLLYPLQIFSNYGMAITENASPLDHARSVLNPMLMALPPMLMLLAVSLARPAGRARAGAALAALACAAGALAMARNVPLLALTALPVVAAAFPARPGRASTLAFAGGLVALAALALAVITGAYARPFPSPIAPTPFGFDDEARYTRMSELQRDGLHGPVFSDYNIGSLVEYNLYPEPGYVDNRPEAFPAAFWRTEYHAALALGPEWIRLVEQRGINAIIVSWPGVKESYVQALMRLPGWALVHMDPLLGVWVRNAPTNARLLAKHAWNAARRQAYGQELVRRVEELPQTPSWRRAVRADELIYGAYSLVCIGEAARAWPLVERLHAQYPDGQIIHELMRVSAPPDALAGVRRVMAQHARWPVAAKQALDWGRALELDGRAREADKVYRRALIFFPLSRELRAAVERLENAQYRALGAQARAG